MSKNATLTRYPPIKDNITAENPTMLPFTANFLKSSMSDCSPELNRSMTEAMMENVNKSSEMGFSFRGNNPSGKKEPMGNAPRR